MSDPIYQLCFGAQAPALNNAVARVMKTDAARIAKLEAKVIAYGVVHADQWARDHGFPNRHYHWQHYDDLEDAGARMDDFVRLGPEIVGEGNPQPCADEPNYRQAAIGPNATDGAAVPVTNGEADE